ncbi:gastrula zinc finger protein XlCGF8.2DB-like [Triplophysa dalaica]|uniref:gastrula zinc finger protein XlCGF8.2DB-like n=1 Tax=Triplophysa dalaica TaxID=1582913 RepID=UPI0024DF7FFF|nr:gastrula zinc finger protein XlCGF8.2DB-like [Triplophysa dalaica]
MSMMMVQVDVMCCKSVGTDLSMLDIDDLMTEICQLKKEVKLLETKLRERDQLNRKDVCGVSLCDFTDQTSPDLLLSVCNEEQKTSLKLLDCEMELKTQIKEEQTDEDDVFYSDLMEVKEEKSEPNVMEKTHFKTEEESLSCLNSDDFSPQKSQSATVKYSCTWPQCGKIFTYYYNLEKHLTIHSRERSCICYQCGKTFRREYHLKRHMRIHTGEKPYKCEQCGKNFIRKEDLNSHMKVHTGEKPYKCHQCGKIFFYIYDLEKHITIHSTERSYKCYQCGTTFRREYHLKRHIKIHTGEKPYKCEQCGKNFIRKEDLTSHKRVHTGEKPYICEQCGKSFAWTVNLKEHLLLHSGVKFQCEQCNKTFISANNLRRHMKLHVWDG